MSFQLQEAVLTAHWGGQPLTETDRLFRSSPYNSTLSVTKLCLCVILSQLCESHTFVSFCREKSSFWTEAWTKTHPVSLFHEVFPADVCHDACGQGIPHYIHHGAESVSVEEEDIWEEEEEEEMGSYVCALVWLVWIWKWTILLTVPNLLQ